MKRKEVYPSVLIDGIVILLVFARFAVFFREAACFQDNKLWLRSSFQGLSQGLLQTTLVF